MTTPAITATHLQLCGICAKAKPATDIAQGYGLPLGNGYYQHICDKCLKANRQKAIKINIRV